MFFKDFVYCLRAAAYFILSEVFLSVACLKVANLAQLGTWNLGPLLSFS